jgi:hypothetical protein
VKIDPRVAEIAKKLPEGFVRPPRGDGPAPGAVPGQGRGPRAPKRPEAGE